MTFGRRPWQQKGPRVDRGRKTHGAKFVYVSEDDEMIEYQAVKDAVDKGELSKSQKDSLIFFRSKREARRWIQLRELQKAGTISELQRQVRIQLLVKRPDGVQESIGVYVLDFVYRQAGNLVYEDVKGYAEDLFKWKKRHLEVQSGIEVQTT